MNNFSTLPLRSQDNSLLLGSEILKKNSKFSIDPSSYKKDDRSGDVLLWSSEQRQKSKRAGSKKEKKNKYSNRCYRSHWDRSKVEWDRSLVGTRVTVQG